MVAINLVTSYMFSLVNRSHIIHSASSKTYKHIYTMLQPFKDKLLPAQLTTDHASCVAALCVGDLLGHCTGNLVFTQGV